MFRDPTLHESIYVRTALFISANEAIVVYRNKMEVADATGGNKGNEIQMKASSKVHKFKRESSTSVNLTVERVVVFGPIRYIEQPNEWLHEFVWHGSDPSDKTKKVAGGLRFRILRVIADQFYYNANDVRTKDDTLLKIKLMVFFELQDIEKMLDNTHDPIADFINNAASDVVAFCSTMTYEQFVEHTSAFNDLVSPRLDAIQRDSTVKPL